MKRSMFNTVMNISNYNTIRSEHSSVRIYLEGLETHQQLEKDEQEC